MATQAASVDDVITQFDRFAAALPVNDRVKLFLVTDDPKASPNYDFVRVNLATYLSDVMTMTSLVIPPETNSSIANFTAGFMTIAAVMKNPDEAAVTLKEMVIRLTKREAASEKNYCGLGY